MGREVPREVYHRGSNLIKPNRNYLVSKAHALHIGGRVLLNPPAESLPLIDSNKWPKIRMVGFTCLEIGMCEPRNKPFEIRF